jgi:DNA-binding transcriptional LysR family regulator
MTDITNLDMRMLETFLAIAEESSVTKAAQRLNMTQQGVSGVLARLRDQFKDPLFVRQAHGVTPTPRARSLYPKIQSAVEGLRDLVRSETFEPAELETVYRVAANDYAQAVVVAPLFGHLKNVAPGLRLVIESRPAGSLSEQLRTGQLDLALTVPEFAPDNIHSSVLFSDRYMCVFRKGHPLASREMSVDAFCYYEHLLVSPNQGDLEGPTDVALARQGLSRTIGLVVPSFLIAVDVIEQSDLVAMLPTRLLKGRHDKLTIVEPPLEVPPFDIISVWPERVNADPHHIWFRELLRLIVGDR